MNLYLDTSALVKLYVEEDGSALVRDLVQWAELVGTSAVAYVETRAAFARRHREGCFSPRDRDRIVRDLDRDWQHYFLIPVTDPLVRRAAGLCDSRGLRAYDSIHLASACMVNDGVSGRMVLASWDLELNRAAADEGLEVVDVRSTPE